MNMNMNINTDLLQKSNIYKAALQKTQAIFESQQSEIEYFQKNHIPWITKAQNIYAIDLNEKYLIFAEGNVAFLSKDIIYNEYQYVNEESTWEFIKNAASKVGQGALSAVKLITGPIVHAGKLVWEGMLEIPKLFKAGEQIDYSKLALGFGGLFEIFALISSFIPVVNTIAPAIAIIGAISLIIGGILELTSDKTEIKNEPEKLKDDSLYKKVESGMTHFIMGIISIATAPLAIFGGAGIQAIKASVSKILSKQIIPIIKSVVSKNAIKLSTHNAIHFFEHYAGACLALLVGSTVTIEILKPGTLKKITDSTINKITNGINEIIRGASKLLSPISKKLSEWASKFFKKFNNIINNILKLIQSALLTALTPFGIILKLIQPYANILNKNNTKLDISIKEIGEQSINNKKQKELESIKNTSAKVKEKIGKNDKGQNIQYVGKVKFDSNKITKKKDDKGNEYLVVTDLKTKKKYGVIRTKDGKYAFRKKTNESKIYENNRQSKNGLLSFDEFLIENLNFNI